MPCGGPKKPPPKKGEEAAAHPVVVIVKGLYLSKDAGNAAGILRVPRDLNEGIGRPTPSPGTLRTTSPTGTAPR